MKKKVSILDNWFKEYFGKSFNTMTVIYGEDAEFTTTVIDVFCGERFFPKLEEVKT